ncbi:hypothetical protein P692DRAFT_201801172 [Suillus brevipes Sb2]|nr:hypothetical protein P692DRAFT_201801172 [Suillus brevipes Sb2]
MPRNSTMNAIQAQTHENHPAGRPQGQPRGAADRCNPGLTDTPELPAHSLLALLPAAALPPLPAKTLSYELGDCPFELMLQNLTEHVTKDEDYPAARGVFGENLECCSKNIAGLHHRSTWSGEDKVYHSTTKVSPVKFPIIISRTMPWLPHGDLMALL